MDWRARADSPPSPFSISAKTVTGGQALGSENLGVICISLAPRQKETRFVFMDCVSFLFYVLSALWHLWNISRSDVNRLKQMGNLSDAL